ncbi:MAG: esterase [Microbacteriaceae bacterium]|nr:esterase [Microbacteriaceae bacterium]
MLNALLDASLLNGAVLRGCYILGCAFLPVLLIGSWGRKLPIGRWFLRLGILASVGVVAGVVFTWWFSDVWDPLGISLSVPTRAWFCALLAGVGIAVGNLWKTRWWSKLLAILAIPVIVSVGALGINADLGEYRTLRAAILGTEIPPLTYSQSGSKAEDPEMIPTLQSWVAPLGIPVHGIVGHVSIPGTQSHFAARPAIVYLPPAALVPNPPALPVIIMLSGQPGQPSDIVDKAGLPGILDDYAKAHNGLAPIVVAADQLSSATVNPMCVDSPIGNSATYLTVDVPNWVRSHFRVQSDPKFWAIAGFSQGGTCAIQLGAGRPDVFGSLVDISGELAPRNGSLSHTIAAGFDGSKEKYAAATPLGLMAAHAPYRDTTAIIAVGKNDSRFAPGIAIITKAAITAGMKVTSLEVAGTGHDWRCVIVALHKGLEVLGERFGIASKE